MKLPAIRRQATQATDQVSEFPSWLDSALIMLLSLPVPCAVQAQTPTESNTERKLRIICFGAYPDDAEYRSSGTATLWVEKGHHVKLVSVTNVDIGNWQMAGGPLARRRTTESGLVAKRLGVNSQVIDIHDGELMLTFENRRTITRLIRDWRADIVIVHRPWDYHPDDHRYVGVLVQDAAFMVTVPLKKNPVYLFG